MNIFIEKLMQMELEISQKKGGFCLFALFLREDVQDKWDLLVSAPWIEKNKRTSMEYLAEIIQKQLSTNELLLLSRIIIIDSNKPELIALQKSISVEHGKVEVKDSNFFGLQIKHAYIITSKIYTIKQI